MRAVKDGRAAGGVKDEAAGAFRMSEALWERVRRLLPERPNTHRFGGGRLAVAVRFAGGITVPVGNRR